MAKRFHELHIAGCTRQLPILNLSDTKAIAAFVVLGDVELAEKCAEALLEKVPKDTEIIMTAETKGIPLAEELARLMGHSRYVTARKSVKAYMEDPLFVEDESITTLGKQRLYLMQEDAALIKGKRVLLLDDVISLGGSMAGRSRGGGRRRQTDGHHLLGVHAVVQSGITYETQLRPGEEQDGAFFCAGNLEIVSIFIDRKKFAC